MRLAFKRDVLELDLALTLHVHISAHLPLEGIIAALRVVLIRTWIFAFLLCSDTLLFGLLRS